MNAAPTHFLHYISFGHILLFLAMVLTFAEGCGQSTDDPSDAGQIESVDTNQEDTDPTESSPGELVMPSDTATTPSEQDISPDDSTVIEMPGLALPSSSSGSESSDKLINGEEKIRYGAWKDIREIACKTGKVTIVDLWSLACEPCLKEFPGLVQLQKDYGDQVECLSVNLDYDGRKTRPPETYEDEVVGFLSTVDASVISSYICSTASDDVFLEEKIPSIPVVLVFDENGKLIKKFIDGGETAGFTYRENVQPLVAELLES